VLNAGNELIAEQAGCVRPASVSERLSPYLTTALDKEPGPVHRSWTRRR
jgi:hypothetical protein